MLDSMLQDVRYALRMCVRAPAFTLIAVLALAIGIGANSAIFTLVDAALIEPLPFKDPERLVAVWEVSARRPDRANVVAPANYFRWRDRARSVEAFAAFADTRTNLTGSGDPEELVVRNATADYFPILGIAPLAGRTFTAEENAQETPTAVILSHALWQRRFGGDPAIVGRSIQLNGTPTTIVGVMPPDAQLTFSNSLAGRPPDLWRPWVMPASWREPRGRFLSVVARLQPGATASRAQTELNAIAASLASEWPEFDTGWTTKVVPVRDELAGDVKPALLLLAGAVGFVLLIACANVANLLLSRAAVRQREIAIRAALGAKRSRVMRQLLTESMVLAIIGGALGLLIAQWGIDAMVALSPVDLSRVGPIRVSRAVLAFTAAVSFATAIVAGLAPAFESARADVQESLKDGGRQVGGGRSARLRQIFVVAEIALAAVLLVGAGLLIRSFAALQSVAPGFDARNVLTMRVSLPSQKYDDPKTLRFFSTAIDRIRPLPGVQAAGLISYLPFAGLGAGTGFTIVGQPPPPPGQGYTVDVSVCDNGYFDAMRLPLTRGRRFTDREQHERSNVVIVNEELVRRYFPGQDPIGRQLVINMTDPNVPTTIVGVVGDAKFADLRSETRPQSYWPHPQLPYSAMTLTVRTAGDPLAFAPLVEREIRSLDKDQPVSEVRAMDQWIARSLNRDRFASFLLTIFAGVALWLAGIGIYGVMSYAVSQRTPEIGVRLALGAETRDILALVLGNAARLAALGLAIGIALAAALARVVSGLLYHTHPTDPLTFVAGAAVLALVALAATIAPARRAARIAPVDALRAG
ncbi:MAG TPA: ABC transporter permease [Vicinamibacterales bacterium]|nr:ABC transporter permease [Vicinamibacterales bacterium]